MANEYVGWQRYLYMWPEATWGGGESSSAGQALAVPYTTYDVQTVVQESTPEIFVGVRQEVLAPVIKKAVVQGPLTLPAFARQDDLNVSLLQHILEWALSGDASNKLDSKSIEKAEAGTDDKRHDGLRVNSLTLSCSAEQQFIDLSLDLIGRDEQPLGALEALDATLVDPGPMTAQGSVLTLDAVETLFESLSVSIQNNLIVKHLAGTSTGDLWYPQLVLAGKRQCELNVVLPKNSGTYDAYKRNGIPASIAGSFLFKGPHNGTGASGSETQCTMSFDRLEFLNAVDTDTGLNSIVGNSITWRICKPNTADNDIDTAYADV